MKRLVRGDVELTNGGGNLILRTHDSRGEDDRREYNRCRETVCTV